MNWLQKMMYGRYGMDQLGLFSVCFLLIFNMISTLFRWKFFASLTTILMLLVIFRMFSKNIARRRQENQVFLNMSAPIRQWFVSKMGRMQDSKTHKHFRCPHCGQKIRVPKGRGKIQITCPNCKESFIKKS